MKARLWLAALAALVLVGLGVVLGSTLGGSDDPPPPPGPGSAPAPAGVSTSTTAAPGGGLPTAGPDDVEFYDYLGGLRLPRSPTAGPTNLAGGLASGFARTPMGAVMAGVNISTRTQSSLGLPVWRPTIEQQVVGTDRVALLGVAIRDGGTETPAPGDRVEGSDSRFAGWQWVSYSPDVAVVRHLLSQVGAGGTVYVAIRVETRWVDGDWRVVAPPGGDWSSAADQVASPVSFQIYQAS